MISTGRLRARLGLVAAVAALATAVTASPQAAAPAPGSAATAAELQDATLGYRATARGDSAVPGATAAAPYKKLWARDFGQVVSAPVAVGNRVFAVVNADPGDEGGPRMELVGLDAATGKDLWPQKFLTFRPNATVTYGGGLLYTQTSDAEVTAFDPATGKQRWRAELGNGYCQFPPTWYDGVLYTHDGRGQAIALRAADGAELWRAPLAESGFTNVAVDATGVWIGFDDIAYQLLDRKTGKEIRRMEVPDVSGPGGNPGVLGDGALWLRSSTYQAEKTTAFEEKTGRALRSLPADATPAFGPGRAYVAYRGKVKALDTATYKTAWTYTSPVAAATVRLVAKNQVYVADADGQLVVLDAKTGRKVWSYRLWPAPHPQEPIWAESDWSGWTVPGIATAGGRLFAPADEGFLIGFGKG
ncbi:PQQ-binding-like beta-propeller repeat protein [Streptomyces physcomitrii]|uniref:outer membrane protein assembly factor BamB family protein n=1 Tax=Streptomyces physcomitrii TaxID=2724184 RepID=UPI0033E78C89